MKDYRRSWDVGGKDNSSVFNHLYIAMQAKLEEMMMS